MKEFYNKENNDLINFILENIDKIDLSDAIIHNDSINKEYINENGYGYASIVMSIHSTNNIDIKINIYDYDKKDINNSIPINISLDKYPKVFEYITDIVNNRTKNSLNFFVDSNPGLKREINIKKL